MQEKYILEATIRSFVASFWDSCNICSGRSWLPPTYPATVISCHLEDNAVSQGEGDNPGCPKALEMFMEMPLKMNVSTGAARVKKKHGVQPSHSALLIYNITVKMVVLQVSFGVICISKGQSGNHSFTQSIQTFL